MLLSSLKTVFVEKSAPYLGAQELNDYWTSIEAIMGALATLPIDQGSWNPTGSTSTSYKLTSYRTEAPGAGELPLAFVIVPTITNGLNATITASWGATAYQVWDMTTNARVAAGVILENRPVQLVFDGTKFWVVSAAPLVHGSNHEPGGSDVARFVYYGGAQTLSAGEKTQACTNMGAASLTNGKVTVTQSSSDIVTYTSSHTLALSDSGKAIVENSTSGIVVTVPASVFPVGAEIEVIRYGSGDVTFLAASGVTIVSRSGLLKIATRYEAGVLKQLSSNVWLLCGALG